MSAYQLEQQLFKIQDMSKPLHTNEAALKGFLEKQVSFWVKDAGYDPEMVDALVSELIPIMGNITHSNIRNHKTTFDAILSQYIGADVEVNWVIEENH